MVMSSQVVVSGHGTTRSLSGHVKSRSMSGLGYWLCPVKTQFLVVLSGSFKKKTLLVLSEHCNRFPCPDPALASREVVPPNPFTINLYADSVDI